MTRDGGSWKVYAGVVVAVAVIAAVIIGSLDHLDTDSEALMDGLRVDKIVLLGQFSELEAENSALREEVARLNRIRQIDREARKQLLEDYGAAQGELEELRRRLALFEAVLNLEEGKPGVKVHSFTLEAGHLQNEYVYDLVLTQIGENYDMISGVVDFTVDGVQGGKSATLSLLELSATGESSIAYEFKYFQTLKGTLVLPDGFTPREIEVRVAPSKDSKRPGSTQRFPWPRHTS